MSLWQQLLRDCHYHACKVPPQYITTQTGSNHTPEMHHCGASAEGEEIFHLNTQSQCVRNAEGGKARRMDNKERQEGPAMRKFAQPHNKRHCLK